MHAFAKRGKCVQKQRKNFAGGKALEKEPPGNNQALPCQGLQAPQKPCWHLEKEKPFKSQEEAEGVLL